MNRYEILLGKIPPPPKKIIDCPNTKPIRLNNIVYGVARKNFKVYPLPESALPHYGDVL